MRSVLEDGTTLDIQSYSCTPGDMEKSYVYLFRQTYRYVFFSSFHDKVWGNSQENSGAPAQGEPLNARQFIDTQFQIQDLDRSTSGSIHLPLSISPMAQEWNEPGTGSPIMA